VEPAPNVSLLERWKELAPGGLMGLASCVMADYFDQCHAASMARRLGKPVATAPLVADSLEPAWIAVAVQEWQPRFARGSLPKP
jgi:hypothetical protein